MTFQLIFFLCTLLTFILLIAYRAAQTIRVVRRFRNEWPEIQREAAKIDIARVQQALETCRVSVLLPAWNEYEGLPKIMSDLLALPFPNVEVLIRAGGGDGSFLIAQHLSNKNPALFRVFEQKPGEGKQGALQALFGEATGDIVYLTDADCRITPNLFAATLSPILFEQATATTVGARPLDSQLCDPNGIARSILYLDYWLKQTQFSNELSGANAACKADWIRETGVFDLKAPIGTDYIMALRLRQTGHQVRYVKLTFVQTYLELEVSHIVWQLSRWLRNAWYHEKRIPVFAIMLSATWWLALLLGSLSYLPVSLILTALGVVYLYAVHPGIYVLASVFPQVRLKHLPFIRLALLYQALPIIALVHHLSSAHRTRW